MNNTQDQIYDFFDKFTEKIDSLSISEEDRAKIYMCIFNEFYSMNVLTSDNMPTRLIKTQHQFSLAMRRIITTIKIVFVKYINQLPDNDIDEILPMLKHKALMSEIGLAYIDDIEVWIIKYLTYKKEQTKLLQKSAPKEQVSNNQFITNLTSQQLSKLFDLLVSNGFIPNNDKAGFIWAFGGTNDNYSSYSTKWPKYKNLAVYLIDCLCGNQANLDFWEIGFQVFGIKGMAQMKNAYLGNKRTFGKPKGYQLIDKILLEVKK